MGKGEYDCSERINTVQQEDKTTRDIVVIRAVDRKNLVLGRESSVKRTQFYK
jgi:16S rRNA G527 N7-methylase RsmG